MNQKFQLIAHRGASKYAPENTKAAFDKAIALGALCIECDIAFSKDNIPVIFHDDELDRTTNAKGAVGGLFCSEILELDAGGWFSKAFQGERVMTLKQLLEWYQQHDVVLNLEIKQIPLILLNDYIDIIIQELNSCPSQQRIIFSSFQQEVLTRLHETDDSRPRAFLARRWSQKALTFAKSNGCIQLNVGHRIVSKRAVDMTHESGLKIGVYTINDAKRATHLKAIGVDAIFTDDLALFEIV